MLFLTLNQAGAAVGGGLGSGPPSIDRGVWGPDPQRRPVALVVIVQIL